MVAGTGARAGEPVPGLITPMSPSVVSGDPPTGADWRIEVAWTGHRCIAYVQPGGRVRLLSAGSNSMTHAYPELSSPLLERCPPGGMVLDGTLVARGEEHASRPRLLGRRHARSRPSAEEIRAVPVDLQVADLLFLDGHSTMEMPYRDRRGLLEGLGFADAPVWTTAVFPAAEFDAVARVAVGDGVDALHVRHLGGRYRPGGRSRYWLRVPMRRTGQVVIGGWTPTDPRKPVGERSIATVLLGVPSGRKLRYVGRVGISAEQRRHLHPAVRGTERTGSPFDADLPADAAEHAVWVTPLLVGRVEYIGWVGGERLRLPRWRGLVAATDIGEDGWARPPVWTDGGRGGGGAAVARVSARPDRPGAGADPGALADAVLDPGTVPGLEPVPAGAAEAGIPGSGLLTGDEVVESRRLEQHFVFNSLNTIASLIRTDPGRARELLVGFADLTRTTDGPPASTLGRELEAVRAYLDLEQARFGRRLHVEVTSEAGLERVACPSARLVGVVREAVQTRIEPLPHGGTLTITAVRVDDTVQVRITAAGDPVVLVLDG